MNGLPIHNPLAAAAKESIAMSKETGDKNFRLLAMVMMGVSGVAAIMHAGHVIWRDLKPARDKDHATPERVQQTYPEMHRHESHLGGEPQVSWVHKARVAERHAGSPVRWTEQAGQPKGPRQH